MKANEETEDLLVIKEGEKLIYDKFIKLLTNKGLELINATGEVFDTELHEAITQVPSPTEKMKGRVIDEVEKGYKLGEKVIRYSKVVIGA
jgi:molecular chaperone GrpE